MTITYELRVHSRDVSIAGIDLNKHTGYDLIAYDENGTAISIQTVDLNALSPLSGPIDFKMYSETLNIPIGGDIIPSKVYVDGEWENTSQQWVSENQYKNVALKGTEYSFVWPSAIYLIAETVLVTVMYSLQIII